MAKCQSCNKNVGCGCKLSFVNGKKVCSSCKTKANGSTNKN